MSGLPTSRPAASLLLVDGFNLLHALILKGRNRAEWWRVENQERVLELVAQYRGREECWVVFDASRAASSRVEQVCVPSPQAQVARTQMLCSPQLYFAPDADAWILERIKLLYPRHVMLVSADRSLQDRARLLGAERLSPWQFSEMLGA